jgi:hypothetical protein
METQSNKNQLLFGVMLHGELGDFFCRRNWHRRSYSYRRARIGPAGRRPALQSTGMLQSTIKKFQSAISDLKSKIWLRL